VPRSFDDSSLLLVSENDFKLNLERVCHVSPFRFTFGDRSAKPVSAPTNCAIRFSM
jgi:hypothetical protein